MDCSRSEAAVKGDHREPHQRACPLRAAQVKGMWIRLPASVLEYNLRSSPMLRFEPDFLISYSDEEVLAELKRLALALNKDGLSRRDIDKHGRVSSGTVIKRFGSLRKAFEAAGLKPIRFMKASDDELIGILIDLWTRTLEKEGRRPFRRDLKAYGFAISSDTFVRKYGSWRAALLRAADSVANEITVETAERAETDHTGLPGDRKALSVRKRFFVFKRDKYRCRMCGATGVELEVDHVVPVANGGSDAIDNLQTLCFKCNRGKRDSAQ